MVKCGLVFSTARDLKVDTSMTSLVSKTHVLHLRNSDLHLAEMCRKCIGKDSIHGAYGKDIFSTVDSDSPHFKFNETIDIGVQVACQFITSFKYLRNFGCQTGPDIFISRWPDELHIFLLNNLTTKTTLLHNAYKDFIIQLGYLEKVPYTYNAYDIRYFFEGFSRWMINLLRGCFNISCPCILSIPQGPEIEANTNFMGVAKQKGGEIFPAQRRSFNFSKSHFDLAQMGGWIFCWGLFPDLLDMFGWTFSRCGAKIGWDHSSET